MPDSHTKRLRQPLLGVTLTTPLGPGIDLMSFHAEERISGLFHASLEMMSDNKSLDFGSIVGEGVTVAIDLPGGGTRHFHGVVSRFMQSGHTVYSTQQDTPQCYYFAELRPWFWLLGKGGDCRIFQNKSVPQIVEELFGDLGQSDFENSLTKAYSPRDYCVQYNETHLDFVCRLFEEEGIFFYFKHANNKHTLVMADATSGIEDCPNGAALTYEESSEVDDVNVVYRASVVESVVHGKYVHDDFNFETPTSDLSVGTQGKHGKQQSRRELYEYPGGFMKTGPGTSLGKTRIEELETQQKVFKAQSLSPALFAGGKFTLSKHFRPDFNTAYAVTRVSHIADSETYSNAFEAIPADVVFRPGRTTPKPTIPGAQTAIVVGPGGEEIHTDKYGRVKVQFHWDRKGKFDDKSSCWVRVAHGWAGKSWGQIYIPRIDQEVVVSFEEGNPDRPLITGSVYNAEQTVPYALPDNQTQSGLKTRSTMKGDTKTFNELRFEDKKGEEQIYFHAEKDFERVVENNDTLKLGFDTKDPGDQKIDIYNDRTITLDQGKDKLVIKKGDRDVLLDKGSHTLKIKAGANTIEVAKDHKLTIKTGNHDVKVSAGKSSTQAGQSIEFKVGSNSLKIDMAGITIKGAMVKIEGTTMTDIKAPVTKIKADGAMMVEAGGLLKLAFALLKLG